MPLYEYQCDACNHRFERIQKYSDPLVDTCSECGGPVRKLISSPAIQFKGSGFYITDYARKDAGAQSAKEGGSGNAAPAATDSAKSGAPASPSTSTSGSTSGSTAGSSPTSGTSPKDA